MTLTHFSRLLQRPHAICPHCKICLEGYPHLLPLSLLFSSISAALTPLINSQTVLSPQSHNSSIDIVRILLAVEP